MELQELIEQIEREEPSGGPLARLAVAMLRHEELTHQADKVLDHFVQAAREADCSWAQIGEVMGVTKQAAQQRHSNKRIRAESPEQEGGSVGLFGRFTPRARTAVTTAEEVARELGHDGVGTEHLLLGFYVDRESIASRALAGWGISREDVLREVEQRIGRGGEPLAPEVHIPFTAGSKRALEQTMRQAIGLGHNYIGTEHILLGVITVEDGVGAQILADRDLTFDQARQVVVQLLMEHLARPRPEGEE